MIKLCVLFKIIRGVMFISPSFTRMAQAADEASLLTVCGMLLHAFRSVFNIRKSIITYHIENFAKTVYKQLMKLFYWIFAQNIINSQCSLLWHWKCLKSAFIGFHSKTINFLFYNYVFNSSQQMTKHFDTISYFLWWGIW